MIWCLLNVDSKFLVFRQLCLWEQVTREEKVLLKPLCDSFWPSKAAALSGFIVYYDATHAGIAQVKAEVCLLGQHQSNSSYKILLAQSGTKERDATSHLQILSQAFPVSAHDTKTLVTYSWMLRCKCFKNLSWQINKITPTFGAWDRYIFNTDAWTRTL